MNFIRRSLGKLLIGLVAAAGVMATPSQAEPHREPACIFAAASLTDAFNTIAPLYEASGRPRPIFNFAASSVLARQIEQGARADAFMSADEAWMDYLAERRLIDTNSRVSFLSNKLVLISPSDRPLNLRIALGMNLAAALGENGKLAMADPESVPAGRYGRAALQNLGVWGSVAAKVVRADNVRAALRFVEIGEAGAGIVYLTDALASGPRIHIVGEFPPTSYPRISYPMAAVRGGRSAEARAFIAFLQTGPAQAVFRQQGFILP
ncbi:MAG: molybdate ABC transporter substrate-binding protein [Caulobacterales bacterium]